MTATAAPLFSRTIGTSVTVSGVGIHTGATTCATLEPAPRPGTGVVFRVRGASGQAEEIPARASNVEGTARCTVLKGPGGASVATVEHLLSALTASGVTDCVVAVDGPELPIGDGSALLWTEALRQAGIVTSGDILEPIAVDAPRTVTGANGAFIAAFPANELRLTVAISFEHALVGTQVARFEPGRGDSYATAIAPARTFGFIEEVEALRASGLARGGSVENAVVVHADHFSSPLRFSDELARHKLLDVLGDLALVGAPLVADIIAVRPSHRLNTDFARLLAAPKRAAKETSHS